MNFRIVGALVLREYQSSFVNSPGGYVWSLIEPIAGLAIITVIFSMGLNVPPLGTSFSVYYATGMIPYLFFMDISTKVAQSLGFSKTFLGLPSVLLVDAILARLLFNSVTQSIVGIIAFIGIFACEGIWPQLNLVRIALSFLILIFFSLGVGTVNIFLFNYFPIWQRLWAITTRPLFLVSGILFLPESTPEPYNHVLWYNPISQLIRLVRTGFYSDYTLDISGLIYVLELVAVTMLIGTLFLLSRFHERLE